MDNKFTIAMGEENNWKKTENNADALKSTTNPLLDLFGTIGALRTRSENDITTLFSLAFNQDKLLATKMSFYARNPRDGLGERRTARIIWKWLAHNYPDVMQKNIVNVPSLGRWDDLYEFIKTPVEENAWELIRAEFKADMIAIDSGGGASLLGKWLKSVNTSSKESRKLGRLTAEKLGLSEKDYRKALSKLRKKIDVVERKMSAGNWNTIKYSGVPSNAMNNYRNAFKKHDEDEFEKYLDSVEKGEQKINASVLYPYDIVEKILYGESEINRVLEQQWKALPNYVDGENNILIVADVSGSMSGRPMATSVGLAIYFAERNKGAFKDKFITFSNQPEFHTIVGNTLSEKINNCVRADWNMNTDIEAVFNLILRAAIQGNLSQDDLPRSIIIISDMEFDQATSGNRDTYYNLMKDKFAQHDYELPMIIFWNVDARSNTFHATPKNGAQFASGQSASVFEALIKGANLTAYDLMLETLNNPIYDCIVV